jgi:hypothetical protein
MSVAVHFNSESTNDTLKESMSMKISVLFSLSSLCFVSSVPAGQVSALFTGSGFSYTECGLDCDVIRSGREAMAGRSLQTKRLITYNYNCGVE